MISAKSPRKVPFATTIATLGLIYHLTVRNIRKTHGNAMIGLAMEVLQSVIFVATFYFMFTFLGMRSAAIRGDFMLYLMSGIFLLLTHTKAMGAIVGADNATSPMMNHRSMNSVVVIVAAAASSLYLQMLSSLVVLVGVHSLFTPLVIDDPIGALMMMLLAWFSGACIGMVFRAVKPWFPSFISIANTVYARLNMIASGKMFVANMLPSAMLPWFQWNPLFHAIDQVRGYLFVNYFPRNSNWEYIIYFSFTILIIGMLGEFYTRKYASVSLASAR